MKLHLCAVLLAGLKSVDCASLLETRYRYPEGQKGNIDSAQSDDDGIHMRDFTSSNNDKSIENHENEPWQRRPQHKILSRRLLAFPTLKPIAGVPEPVISETQTSTQLPTTWNPFQGFHIDSQGALSNELLSYAFASDRDRGDLRAITAFPTSEPINISPIELFPIPTAEPNFQELELPDLVESLLEIEPIAGRTPDTPIAAVTLQASVSVEDPEILLSTIIPSRTVSMLSLEASVDASVSLRASANVFDQADQTSLHPIVTTSSRIPSFEASLQASLSFQLFESPHSTPTASTTSFVGSKTTPTAVTTNTKTTTKLSTTRSSTSTSKTSSTTSKPATTTSNQTTSRVLSTSRTSSPSHTTTTKKTLTTSKTTTTRKISTNQTTTTKKSSSTTTTTTRKTTVRTAGTVIVQTPVTTKKSTSTMVTTTSTKRTTSMKTRATTSASTTSRKITTTTRSTAKSLTSSSITKSTIGRSTTRLPVNPPTTTPKLSTRILTTTSLRSIISTPRVSVVVTISGLRSTSSTVRSTSTTTRTIASTSQTSRTTSRANQAFATQPIIDVTILLPTQTLDVTITADASLSLAVNHGAIFAKRASRRTTTRRSSANPTTSPRSSNSVRTASGGTRETLRSSPVRSVATQRSTTTRTTNTAATRSARTTTKTTTTKRVTRTQNVGATPTSNKTTKSTIKTTTKTTGPSITTNRTRESSTTVATLKSTSHALSTTVRSSSTTSSARSTSRSTVLDTAIATATATVSSATVSAVADNSSGPDTSVSAEPTTKTTTTSTATKSSLGGQVTQTIDVTSMTYIDAMLLAHNVHRPNHTAEDLVWNQSLANIAMSIAQTCVYKHNTTAGGGGYGQNIGAGAKGNAASLLINNLMYNNELGHYPGYNIDDQDMTDFHAWGHYSQIAWASTTSVGCATFDCSRNMGGLANTSPAVAPFFTVCNYGPPGNYLGEFREVREPVGLPTVVFVVRASSSSS